MSGIFWGIGVGPGDPELLTLKAARIIQSADVLAYLVGESGSSQAKQIASLAIAGRISSHDDIAIEMLMSTDREAANHTYDMGADKIASALKNGLNVAFLCEGDPLFFGSFTYLMERLSDTSPIEVIPGISSIHAAAAVLQHPLTVLTESFCVVSGRHTEKQLVDALSTHDSVVIMKAGRARSKIIKSLALSARTHEAQYVEYVGRENQYIEKDITQLTTDQGPYFSLFIVSKTLRGTR